MSEAIDRSTESDLAGFYRQQSYWLDSIEESLEPLWEPEPMRWLGITGVKAWRRWFRA